MIYPRPLTSIHQIEMTSICNLRCPYCAWPKMPRPKMHMSRPDYDKALDMVRHFVKKGTQTELNLAGIGESTLHPDFVENVSKAREAVGEGGRLVLATNGLTMTEELARDLVPFKPCIWVSLHRPEKAGPAVQILKRHGLLWGTSADPSVSSINWAGQVEYHVSAAPSVCPWLRDGWVMVMADGRLTTCCLDASGVGVVGHVDDDPDSIAVQPYGLCEKCHQVPPPADRPSPPLQEVEAKS